MVDLDYELGESSGKSFGKLGAENRLRQALDRRGRALRIPDARARHEDGRALAVRCAPRSNSCAKPLARNLKALRARTKRATFTLMDELTQRVIRENHEKRLARIASAKAAAPAAKEPLDVELVKRTSRTGALGKMSDEELAVKLEDLYYVDHPSYLMNQQLVVLIQQLADYE